MMGGVFSRLFFSSLLLLLSVSLYAREIPISPLDHVEISDLPPIGKWMVDENGDVAHWLGYKIKGLRIDEPINVIIRIRAESADEAEEILVNATHDAGFLERSHHSSGYQAYLDGQFDPQFSQIPKTAFSDGEFLKTNNHGRIFGPLSWNGNFIFLGAFSREKVVLINKLIHPKTIFHMYSSFNQARDRFANRLQNKAGAQITDYINLDNSIPNDGVQTTGDHDGMAVLLDL